MFGIHELCRNNDVDGVKKLLSKNTSHINSLDIE